MKYLYCVLGLMLVCVGGRAEPILEMGVSARSMALGGAFAAIADDESAVFYNPAGLAFLKQTIGAAFYQRAFEVVHHLALTGAMRGWGAQLIQIATGPLESTNEFGNPSGEELSYTSRAGLLAAAVGIGNIALGLRGKLYGDELDWGVDVGTLILLDRVRLGVVAENILGSAALDVRAGTAVVFQLSSRFTMTIALEGWRLLSQPEVHVGLELSVNGVQIRAGSDGVAFVSGAGAHWNSVRLDWAYRMHPHLPASTIVTVAYLF